MKLGRRTAGNVQNAWDLKEPISVLDLGGYSALGDHREVMAEVHRRRLLMALHHTEAALGAMRVRGHHVNNLFRCRGTEPFTVSEPFRRELMNSPKSCS